MPVHALVLPMRVPEVVLSVFDVMHMMMVVLGGVLHRRAGHRRIVS